MIKHVGKHGDRKVAVIFREVPGEEHMCLVVYTETLPVAMHDALVRAIETPHAQNADTLGEALEREMFNDGRPILATLHREGMMKKVQTKQVVMTPNPSSHVNLEEMNGIIRKINQGNEGARQLAELDANRGMTGKARRRDDFGREIGAPSQTVRQGSPLVAGSDASKTLSDTQLAENLATQAQRMEAEAKQLLAESARLSKEAAEMRGENFAQGASSDDSKKRGRPKKVAANAVN